MNEEINIEVVDKLFKNKKSKEIMTLALHSLIFSNKKEKIVIILIAIIPAILIGISVETQYVFVDTCQTIIDITLALLGIVFTGYVFFQALINKKLLIKMIENIAEDEKGEPKSKLQETNESFVACMMLNLLLIVLTLLLKIIASSIPSQFLLLNSVRLSNITVIVMTLLYLYIVLNVINEVRSFMFNVFQLFNLHAGTRIIDLIKNEGAVVKEKEISNAQDKDMLMLNNDELMK